MEIGETDWMESSLEANAGGTFAIGVLEPVVDDGRIVNAKRCFSISRKVKGVFAIERDASETGERHGIVGVARAEGEIEARDMAGGGAIERGDIGQPRPEPFVNGAIKFPVRDTGRANGRNEFEIIGARSI